ncbi:MAG: hypothetical protein GX085_04310 [Firmicutes bacterium]|nr:hypothetical protein [Bacillota bacterium]
MPKPIRLPKEIIFKNLSALLLSFLLLFLMSSSSHASLVDGGDLKVRFSIDADNSGFSFEDLTLNFNAGLGAKDGIKGEFSYGAFEVETIAYYYIKDVIYEDEVNIGRFSIDWASASSETINGSLAQKLQRQGGTTAPADSGFYKGVGVKYKTAFDNFALVTSVSNHHFGDGADLAGRGSFHLNPDLQIGVGVASINRARGINANDFGLLIDAGYRTGPLHLLCEVVSINSRRHNDTETKTGFYVEAAYELSKKSLLYGGFYGTESLTGDLLVVGYKADITPHTAVQGEIGNARDNWRLTLGLNVNF